MFHRRFSRMMIGILLVLYVYAIIKIIVYKFDPIDVPQVYRQLLQALHHPGYLSEKIHEGNLKPLREIHRTLRGRSLYDLICLFGNLAIFMPLGSFVGLLSGRRGIPIFAALLASFGFSLMLETTEALLDIGVFDVDDLLLNTAGGLLGCFVFQLYAAFWDANHASRHVHPDNAYDRAEQTSAILSEKVTRA